MMRIFFSKQMGRSNSGHSWLTLMLAVCILVTSFPTMSLASSSDITYPSKEGNYLLKKISKQTSPTDADGIVDIYSPDGSGVITADGQSYSWASVAYKEDIYIASCYGAIYNTLVNFVARMVGDINVSKNDIKELVDILWRGEMFSDNPDFDFNKSIIVKIDTLTGEITPIVTPFDSIDSVTTYGTSGYRNAKVFKDKLYFVNSQARSKLIEIDPKTDSAKVVYTSHGANNRLVTSAIRAMTVHEGQLLVTVCGDIDNDGIDEGVGLVASSNPTEGQDSFTLIAEQKDFLNYPTYKYIDPLMGSGLWDMVSFNGKVYVAASTYNEELPKIGDQYQAAFCLFEGQNKGTLKNPDWSFQPIIGKPWEHDGSKYPVSLGASRAATANLEVHGDHLYIGGYNDPMKALPEMYLQIATSFSEGRKDPAKSFGFNFKRFYLDVTNPVKLWRMDRSNEIELVVGKPDGTVFTDPPLSGLGGGFGKNGENYGLLQYVWDMESYDNKLYIGAFDVSTLAQPIRQFTNGDILHGWDFEEFSTLLKNIQSLLSSLGMRSSSMPAMANATTNMAIQEPNFTPAEIQDMLNELETLNDIVSVTDFATQTAVPSTQFMSPHARFNPFTPTRILLQTLITSQENLEKLISSPVIKWILGDTLVQRIAKEIETMKVVIENLTYFIGSLEVLNESEIGSDSFVSSDGVHFETLFTDGLGAPGNHGVRTFAPATTGLTLGTANPYNGTQIWQIIDKNRRPMQNSTVSPEEVYWFISKPKDLTFDIDYNGNTLQTIQLKETAIDLPTNQYRLLGDTAIIDADYFTSLGVGKHELRFYFSNNGFVDVTVNILATIPQTGDDAHLLLYVIALMVSLGGIVLVLRMKKKHSLTH